MPSLAEIRNDVRIRADIEHELKRYPDSELNSYINSSYKELYGMLVNKLLIRPENTVTITTDGSLTYELPSDFYATLGVFTYLEHTWGDLYRLQRHSVKDRPFGHFNPTIGSYPITKVTYRVAEYKGKKQIEFYHPLNTVRDYYISYVPLPGNLVDDSDSVDDMLAWIEYVIVDASIKVLRKENSSTTSLERDKRALLQRISDEADSVEMTESARITDSQESYYWHSRFQHS